MANRIIKPDSGNTLVLQDEGGSAALTIPTSGIPDFPNGLTLAGNATGGDITGVTLDDYEEGTFTPEAADAATGGNTGTASAKGHYTKIGRIVHLNFSLTNINTSGMGASFVLRNLPFATLSDATLISFPSGSVYSNHLTLDSGEFQFVFDITDGDTYGLIRTLKSAAPAGSVETNDINSGVTDLRIAITYKTS